MRSAELRCGQRCVELLDDREQIVLLERGRRGTNERGPRDLAHAREQRLPERAGRRRADRLVERLRGRDELAPPHIGDRQPHGERDRAEIVEARAHLGLHTCATELELDRIERDRERRHAERDRFLGRRAEPPAPARCVRSRRPDCLDLREIDRVGDVEQAQRDDGARAHREIGGGDDFVQRETRAVDAAARLAHSIDTRMAVAPSPGSCEDMR